MRVSRRARGLALIALLILTASCRGRSEQAAAFPATPTVQGYIQLSLESYQAGRWEESLDACRKALELDPANPIVYNNICAAYNQLQKWDEAISACETALTLNPAPDLAEWITNNLRWAEAQANQ